MIVRVLTVVLMVLLFGAGAAGADGPGKGARRVTVGSAGSYTVVSPDTLAAMLARKDFLFVNVHIPYQGEIERTDQFVPYNAIEANRDRLPARKDAKVVLYCLSGPMSTIAARTLVKLGYTNVWELDGGMAAWEDAGRTLQQRRR